MALIKEEDRLKFFGEGTGIKRTDLPTFMEKVRAADAVLGKGINYVGENLPKVPKKLWDATVDSNPGIKFLSRLASNTPNPFNKTKIDTNTEQLSTNKAKTTANQPINQPTNQPTNNITPQDIVPAKVTTLSNGWTSTPDESVYGGRRLSFGTSGKPGSGTGYVSGSARGSFSGEQSNERFLSEVARRNQMGRGQVGGLSFEGSGADFAKFAQMPTRPVGQGGNTTATNPIDERGLGIKARLVKYKEDLEHQRALAQYPGMALDNKIKEDDLATRKEFGALRNQLLTLTPGTPEYTETERRLATLSGKFGEQKEPNIQIIDEQLDPTDPSSPMVKRPIRINRDGSYTRMNENVAPINVTAESFIQNDPLLAERYAKLSPEERTRMIQEMNKRMAERQAQ